MQRHSRSFVSIYTRKDFPYTVLTFELENALIQNMTTRNTTRFTTTYST